MTPTSPSRPGGIPARLEIGVSERPRGREAPYERSSGGGAQLLGDRRLREITIGRLTDAGRSSSTRAVAVTVLETSGERRHGRS